jgi:hypothetical protein
MEDFEGTQLRIDEALKDRQKGDARIGDTKTDESDNFVPVPPDLEREVGAWIATRPNRNDPRAFLFPSSAGTAFSVGNYLKRYLKPLAEKAGVPDVTRCGGGVCIYGLSTQPSNVKPRSLNSGGRQDSGNCVGSLPDSPMLCGGTS